MSNGLGFLAAGSVGCAFAGALAGACAFAGALAGACAFAGALAGAAPSPVPWPTAGAVGPGARLGGLGGRRCAARSSHDSLSMIMAMPWPPPTHMVSSPIA